MDQINHLKEIKEGRRLSLERMSREIGISGRTLFRWLHFQNVPSLLASEKLSAYLQKQKMSQREKHE